MAATVGEHVQEVNWSFSVREVFHPRSTDGSAVTVLAGNVLSGEHDEPIGRPVQVFVAGQATGQGTVVSRYRFNVSASGQAAYVYEGNPISREDINRGAVLKTT